MIWRKMNTSYNKMFVVLSREGFTEVLRRQGPAKSKLALVAHTADPLKNRAYILAQSLLKHEDLLNRSPCAYLRLEVLDSNFLRLTLSGSHSHASAVTPQSVSDDSLYLACRQLILTDAGHLEEALSVATERLTKQ
jgi:hypothetical protein